MSVRLGQLTLVVTIVAVGYFVFSYVQGSVKTGLTLTNPASTLETGLVGHWTFDGPDTSTSTTNDISGNGHTGTFVGVPVVASGAIGQSLSFPSTNDYVEVTQSGELNEDDTISLSFWAKGSTPNVIWGRLFIKDSGGGNAWMISSRTTGPDLQLRTDTSGGVAQYDNIPDILDGDWHHVVAVIDSGAFKAYRDTVSVVDSSYIHGDGFGGTGNLNIGGSAVYADFTGALDDVRMYNRVLTTDEINQLYKMGSSKVGKTNTPAGLETGLVGHWTFDGPDMDWASSTAEVLDRSGNENHGDASDMTSTSSPVGGIIGQGLNYDGIDDAVKVSTSSGISNLGPVTYSVWIKPRSMGSGGVGRIIHKGNPPSTVGSILSTKDTNRVQFTTFTDGSGINYQSVDNTLELNNWQHIVMTWDGTTDSGNVHLYKNSQEVSYATTNTGSGSYLDDSDEPLVIGNNTTAGVVEFDGSIDELRVYNRVLATDEITQLYKMGGSKIGKTNTPTGLASGLVGHWTFDGKDMDWSATTAEVLDVSGNGNDGNALNGMTSTSSPTEGAIGQALDFDGNLAYVTTSYASELAPANFTISLWAKSDVLEQAALFRSAGGNGFNNGFALLQNANGTANFRWGDGVSFDNGLSSINDDSLEWRHLVGTYDGSAMKLFVNGVFENEDTSPSFGYSGTPDQYFGNSSGVEEYDGKIDDVRLYNRALSAAEIQQLYNMGN